MITGKDHDIHDVAVVGRLSPSSMSAIIQQVLSQEPLLANSLNLKHFQTTVSDKTSSATDATLTGSTTTASYEELKNIPLYQKFLISSYNLERFLDFVSVAFDEMDYSILRDNLNLPKKALSRQEDLNCGCDDHRQKTAQPDDEGPRNFWRTWDKMVRCAVKLKLNRNPSEILMHLSETSRILGWQRKLQFALSLIYSRRTSSPSIQAETMLYPISSFRTYTRYYRKFHAALGKRIHLQFWTHL